MFTALRMAVSRAREASYFAFNALDLFLSFCRFFLFGQGEIEVDLRVAESSGHEFHALFSALEALMFFAVVVEDLEKAGIVFIDIEHIS